MSRNFFLCFVVGLTFLVVTGPIGCTRDMTVQKRFSRENQESTTAPRGTVPYGIEATAQTDVADLKMLTRGHERYEIHCTPCHDASGEGSGTVVLRGFPRPRSLQDPSVKSLTDENIYQIITHGKGAMAGYANFITTGDRRAIVAFVRILQNRPQIETATEKQTHEKGEAQ